MLCRVLPRVEHITYVQQQFDSPLDYRARHSEQFPMGQNFGQVIIALGWLAERQFLPTAASAAAVAPRPSAGRQRR